MYDRHLMKLVTNTKEGSQADAVWRLMKRTSLAEQDSQELESVAPPGDLAKQLQLFLESHQNINGNVGKGSGRGKGVNPRARLLSSLPCMVMCIFASVVLTRISFVAIDPCLQSLALAARLLVECAQWPALGRCPSELGHYGPVRRCRPPACLSGHPAHGLFVTFCSSNVTSLSEVSK